MIITFDGLSKFAVKADVWNDTSMLQGTTRHNIKARRINACLIQDRPLSYCSGNAFVVGSCQLSSTGLRRTRKALQEKIFHMRVVYHRGVCACVLPLGVLQLFRFVMTQNPSHFGNQQIDRETDVLNELT